MNVQAEGPAVQIYSESSVYSPTYSQDWLSARKPAESALQSAVDFISGSIIKKILSYRISKQKKINASLLWQLSNK